MRLFSPFAILGLLHVARGGELDSFSGDRARHIHQNLRGRNSSGVSGSPDPDSALSAPGSLDLPPAFRKAYERSELHKRVFDQIDADGDGHIIADDVLKALEFWWDDAPTVRRILRTFGIHDIDGAFENETTREKRMSKPEFLDLAERSPVEGSKQTSHCPALKDKIESCDINGVIKCSKYLQAAQAFCRVGQRNIIETCIMSESCSNVCDCIFAAENAVDGKAVLVDQQGVNVLQHPSSLGHHEQGLQPRFWFIAFLVALFAVDIALIIKEVQRHDAEVAWLDTKFWDGSASPPACSVYVYWGSCAYIWDSKSKECPGGGQRVYGNSCKDHFRYGSKGCGALDAKCQSLCTKTNPNQCPCDIFDWTDYVDQDMPGADLPNSSFFTQLVSDCRSACAKRADCKAFVLTPPKGNKDDKSHNCWLKSAQRPTQRSDGAVTFFRKGDGGNSCGKTIPITTNGAYNGDWWPEGSTKKRDSTELVPRGAGDKVPFLFNPRDELFYRAARLIEELYRARINNDLTWQRHQALRGPIGANEINRNVNYGLPSNPIYVSNATLPAWNPVELGYRIRAVFNSLFDLAANRVDNPVIQYLANTPSGTDAEYAMFPRTVRELLESNARTIHAPSRDINDIWIGTGRAYQRGGSVPPYANIEVGYDQRLTYWQGGNAGPFSLEAAFILATQVAGVNFNNLARAVERSTSNRPRGDPWWMGVMTTDDVDPTNMYTEDSTGCQIRQYGRTVRSSGSAQHDTDAGVYMAFDLDPNLAANSTNRNVFVFVVHAIDRSAVIQVPQDRLLRQVTLTRYTPSTTGRVYNAATPNGGDAPRIPTSASDRVPTRVFAVTHAAIVPLQNLQDWLQSFSGRFPIYDQIGASHFYILTEDDVIFPRRNWRRDNGGSGSS